MKYKILLIILLISSAVTFSQKKIFFDVKIKDGEKLNLFAARVGTIYFLKESSDYGVDDKEEDYALWLRNYETVRTGDILTISFLTELRTRSDIKQGKLLAHKLFEIRINVTEPVTKVELSEIDRFKQKVPGLSREQYLEGYLCGKNILPIVKRLLEKV